MTEKPKTHGRARTPEAARFHSQVAELKPLLPSRYAEMATRIFPELDAKSLRYAVAGRKEYWDGLPALRIVAGLEPLPKGKLLNQTAEV